MSTDTDVRNCPAGWTQPHTPHTFYNSSGDALPCPGVPDSEFMTMGCLDALAHPAHVWRHGYQPYQCPGRKAYNSRTGMPTAQPLTGAELVAAVTQLLARTEHDPECHPDPGCQCVIGDLERVLPRCQARDGEWACLSLPHNDGQHYYGRRVGLTLTESDTPTPNTGRMMHVHAAAEQMSEVAEGIADVQDQLRELLSYCREETATAIEADDGTAAVSYNDVATKLADILDGED